VSRGADGDAQAPGHRQAFRDASLARRLGALLYEALLLFAMAVIVGFAFLPLVSPSTGAAATLRIPSIFGRTILFCALVAAAAGYYTWSWSAGRRTLPQKTWRLRLVDASGHAPSTRDALLRYAAFWLGPVAALTAFAVLHASPYRRYTALLLALNFAWALIDRDRQFLHDRLARTRIVKDG
jgi:uncharacterized RDD family membrane protein YckC